MTNQKMDDNLIEFFALPIGLKEVVRLDGKLPLYSSVKLMEKYREALLEQKQFNGARDLIDRLIKTHRILPVFINKGFFRLTLFKLFASPDARSTCGFYIPDQNLIVILIDNNMTLGWVSNKLMASLTSHELCHMAAKHMGLSFYNFFKDDLIAYYRRFFYLISACAEVDSGQADDLITKYVATLYKQIEMKLSKKTTIRKETIVHNFNQTLGDIHIRYESKNEEMTDYIDKIKYLHEMLIVGFLTSGLNGLIVVINKWPQISRFFLTSLLKSYAVFNNRKTPTVFPIQELFYPSEVICVKSEIQVDSKYVQAWRKIK